MRKTVSAVVIIALILWLGLALLAPPVGAFPVRGDESWSDTFDSNEGIREFSDTRVGGGKLKLRESDPIDLGVAVPGESTVYAVLGTALGDSNSNVYCGTGDRGHLVEHNPEELYQEGYQGPVHWGVSNSRGQPMLPAGDELRVTALTTDGSSLVYGGTDPDGHLFSFEPYDGVGDPVQGPCQDLDAAPGGGGILALAFSGGVVYGGTSNGHVFSYTDLEGFNDLLQPSGAADAVLALEVSGTELYIGSEDGHLYSYTLGDPPGTFNDLEQPSGSNAINALAVSGTDLFIGSNDGHLYIHVISGAGFSDQGVPANSGGAPINALSPGAEGRVYGGTGDDGSGEGHLFCQSGFEGHGSPEEPPSAITGVTYCSKTIYLANQAGELYTYAGPATYNPLGSTTDAINDIDSASGKVYLGCQDGHLYRYQDALEPLGSPGGSPIRAVLAHDSTVYLGLEDGELHSFSGSSFSLLDTLPLGVSINDLAWNDGKVFIAAADGNLYSWDGSLLEEHGHGFADGTAINALAVEGGVVYLGLEGGNLFSFDGSFHDLESCGSPVRSLADGDAGVLCGTSGGNLWMYDGVLRDLGSVPGSTGVRSLRHINDHVFGGTTGGKLFSHEDAFLADRGWVVHKQVMLFCMVYDPNVDLVYAGTYRQAHFLIIDPATNQVWDRGRPVNGEREIEDIIVANDGTVYGATYAGTGGLADPSEFHNPQGGRLFEYDPATGEFADLGRPPAPDENWWVSALAEGPEPDYLIYGATSNCASEPDEGRLFSYDPDGGVKTDLEVPVEGEGVLALVLCGHDDKIYGGTWKVGTYESAHLFRYEGAPGDFTDLGEPPVEGERFNMSIASLCYSGQKIYGGLGNGYFFSYDVTGPGYDLLEKPFSGTCLATAVTAAPDGVIWFGTRETADGHVVTYDPALGAFRDVCMPIPGERLVGSTALTQAGVLFGGTSADGHVFRLDPYKTGVGPCGTSVDITPGLMELGMPESLAGHDSVGALCAYPGDAKVVFGGTANDESVEDARLFAYHAATGEVYDCGVALVGHKKILSLAACDDGFIYGGTGNDEGGEDARLFRFDPVSLRVDDLGVPLEYAKGIFSLIEGNGGEIYIGTGDKGSDPARLVRYDPLKEEFTGIGDCVQGRLLSMALGPDGWIYGGTGVSPGGSMSSSARFIKYDPLTQGIVWDCTNPEFSDEHSAHSMSVGDGKVYFGTGPGGKLVSYDPASQSFDNLEEFPYQGEGPVLSLATAGGGLYGGAGNSGCLFRFVPGRGFTDKGPVTYQNSGVTAATTDDLGKLYLGTTGECRLVRFDPDYRFAWDQVTFIKDESPPGTEASIELTDESGVVIAGYEDMESPPRDISGIDPLEHPGLRLRGRLSTTDTNVTPTVDQWSVTWEKRPGMDTVEPEQAYRGDFIYIWGSNFAGEQGGSKVTVGGAEVASYGYWSDNLLQVEVPSGAAGGTVVVTVGGHQSDTGTFSLLETPSVASVSPPEAHAGDIVEVRGSWFLDELGASYVSFNGVVGSDYQSWSDGEIKVRVPAGAVTGDLTANVNGHASNAVGFTVLPGGGPVVKITEPADSSAVAGLLTVRATAQSDEKVDRMEFMVDDNLIGTDKTAPYECQWDTDAEVDGARRLTARACDEVGREGQDEITAYVDHTVPRPSEEWYFAEGCTDYGFETWVLIQNPAGEATVAHVTFMDDTGETKTYACDLPADSRTTVNAAAEVPGANISVEVRAGHEVICERAMYWNGRVEGHGSIGTTSLSRDWYFAEGCTDYGFETYVLVGNPGDDPVEVTLRYMFDDGGVHTTKHLLEPHSRLTVDALDEVGPGEFSVHVGSGEPGVVAERAMYYGGRNCGTGTIGCKAPSNTWYLSEGSTDWGFETWLLIGNPGDDEARVTVTYRESGGETVEKVYTVGGNTRHTVNLQTAVGIADVSTQVSSDVPVVCERAMYWNNRGAGHCTVGSPGPGTTWYLAEGCTDYGFETWLLIDNPGEESQTATVTFMTQDGSVVPVQVELPPRCRTSLDAAQYVPASSFSVRITTPEPVMAERAMYWNGRQGGTGSIGAR
ncbi:MAG: IPT/TIG domain-containing protein [Actinobacteria bacterium]|nr:IPT/TIG domain-containing protein [Actinomycetota bacterium]MBU4358349.1 IPT/TIG domain-containing protein [Actinomycetota bacterium]MBU4392770.1 IPT/TIG domain-containing protein [Actinomycetota bacterium]MBU4402414.1 IPT/TIG domain-containing protein [Actinomycetota bacterium]MBU4441647.1 IPT/TIG domain-containing protein [Actinomycetota bacterium]